MDEEKAVELQRKYYRETAARYDGLHLEADPEHQVALGLLAEFTERHGFESILDLGSGTGRVIQFFEERSSSLRVVGIEPVIELRNIGHDKGISPKTLVDGDATALSCEDGSFDLIYKDPLEDNLNGNEKFYDSPSEMFADNKEKLWLKYVQSRLCSCPKRSCPLEQTAQY